MWCHLLVALILLASAGSVATARDACTREVFNNTQYVTNGFLESRKRTLENTFGQLPDGFRAKIDIVFVVDRSKSIDIEFPMIIETIRDLLSILTASGYILVHRDFTRVAVVSFDNNATVDIGGLRYENASDACVVDRQIQTRIKNMTNVEVSNVCGALGMAMRVLGAARIERNTSRQVIWLFHDGEEDRSCDASKYPEQERSIQQAGVTVFAAGVGIWLNNVTKYERLQSLAFNNDETFTACISQWWEVFDLLSPGSNRDNASDIFLKIPEQYKDRCGNCSQDEVCGCNAITRSYACTEKTVETLPPDTETTTPTPGPTTTVKLLTQYLAGPLAVLMLIILVTSLAVKRKKSTKRTDNRQLPPPHCLIMRQAHDPEENQATKEPEKRKTNVYSVIHDYLPWFIRNPDMMRLDRDMADWPAALSYIKQSKGLQHLAVCSLPKNRWAKTKGSPFKTADFWSLENVMRNPRLDAERITLAGYTYDIERDSLSESAIHASRSSYHGDCENVWVSMVLDYIIIGVANSEGDEQCLQAVQDIREHLFDVIQAENVNSRHTSDGYLTPRRMVPSIHPPRP